MVITSLSEEALIHLINFFLNPIYLWVIISFILFAWFGRTLIKMHRDPYNDFDLQKLFGFDEKTGKASDSKVRLNIAFLISLWAFVYLVMDGKFTEWYFMGFMAAWVSDRFFSRNAAVKAMRYDERYEDRYPGYEDGEYGKEPREQGLSERTYGNHVYIPPKPKQVHEEDDDLTESAPEIVTTAPPEDKTHAQLNADEEYKRYLASK